MTTYLVGAGGYGGECEDCIYVQEFTNMVDMEWRRITGVFYYKIEADSEEEAKKIGTKNHAEFKKLVTAIHNIERRAMKKYGVWPTIYDMDEIVSAQRR
jgi:hypothetical protein